MKKEYERFSENGLFEGIVSLRALISNMEKTLDNPQHFNQRRIETVYYDRARADRESKEFSWLTHRSKTLNFSVQLRERDEIDDMAVGNTHGGIVIRAGDRELLTTENMPIATGGFHVLMQGIEDPYNFGYALRSLYAAGVDGVWLGERNWMSAAGVVCRASAGASELLPMAACHELACAQLLKKKGYTLVCADLRDAVPLWEAKLTRPLLLVIGGEKRGISRQLFALSDLRVQIDYERPFDASLSAASAATVVAFEVYRQNRISKQS